LNKVQQTVRSQTRPDSFLRPDMTDTFLKDHQAPFIAYTNLRNAANKETPDDKWSRF